MNGLIWRRRFLRDGQSFGAESETIRQPVCADPRRAAATTSHRIAGFS